MHLGTMGVYGYGWSGSAPIPEGYLTVKVPTPDGELEREILHPANPGSVYHLTKTLDQLMFSFYASNDRLRITDLHQGIVWGTQTEQTIKDERLINRFDYDGDYGTVLNRFLMQAAIGHPLTVHGTGGQTRAFIHIRDTVRCIELAIANPPEAGAKPLVRNQITETHRVLRPGQDDRRHDRHRDRLPAQPAAGGRGERAVRPQRPVPGPGSASRRPCPRACSRRSPRSRRSYRHRADPAKIIARSVWRAGHGDLRGPAHRAARREVSPYRPAGSRASRPWTRPVTRPGHWRRTATVRV